MIEKQKLLERANALLAKGEWDDGERGFVISNLLSHAGYRLFSEDYFCHKVYYYETSEAAEFAGLAIRLRGDAYVGGPFSGTPCGRDSGFDRIDKQYGNVYGVTCQ